MKSILLTITSILIFIYSALFSESLLLQIIAAAFTTIAIMFLVVFIKSRSILKKYYFEASYFALNIENIIPYKTIMKSFKVHGEQFEAEYLCRINSFEFKNALMKMKSNNICKHERVICLYGENAFMMDIDDLQISKHIRFKLYATSLGLVCEVA